VPLFVIVVIYYCCSLIAAPHRFFTSDSTKLITNVYRQLGLVSNNRPRTTHNPPTLSRK